MRLNQSLILLMYLGRLLQRSDLFHSRITKRRYSTSNDASKIKLMKKTAVIINTQGVK